MFHCRLLFLAVVAILAQHLVVASTSAAAAALTDAGEPKKSDLLPAADQPEHLRYHYKKLADNHLKECLVNRDQTSCQTNTVCTWCHSPGKEATGLCFPTMYASVAQCDKWGDMDTKCMLAGLPDDDEEKPKSLCGKAMDSEGKTCTWCDVAFGAGICMDQTQAEAAGRWISCDSSADMPIADS